MYQRKRACYYCLSILFVYIECRDSKALVYVALCRKLGLLDSALVSCQCVCLYNPHPPHTPTPTPPHTPPPTPTPTHTHPHPPPPPPNPTPTHPHPHPPPPTPTPTPPHPPHTLTPTPPHPHPHTPRVLFNKFVSTNGNEQRVPVPWVWRSGSEVPMGPEGSGGSQTDVDPPSARCPAARGPPGVSSGPRHTARHPHRPLTDNPLPPAGGDFSAL